MGTSYSGFAIKSGSFPSDPGGVSSDAGIVGLSQVQTLQAASVANVDAQFVLPKNALITDIYADSTVAWTATTASLTVGYTAGGTDILTGFDAKTVTRGSLSTATASQLAALSIGTNTSIWVRVASTGANAVGTTRVVIRYIHFG